MDGGTLPYDRSHDPSFKYKECTTVLPSAEFIPSSNSSPTAILNTVDPRNTNWLYVAEELKLKLSFPRAGSHEEFPTQKSLVQYGIKTML